MDRFLEQLEGLSPEAKIYLKPVGFLDNPQYYNDKNIKLNNSLIWFSQIEYWIIDGDGKTVRALSPAENHTSVFESLPEHLAISASQQFAHLTKQHEPLECGNRTVRFDQPHVMGILNMTPDSFSDGGKHDGDPQAAANAAFDMATAGASIIDIGGESTRPGAETVWEGDEIKRKIVSE